MLTKVTLVTAEDGEVQEAYDSETGAPLLFDIKTCDTGSAESHESVHLNCTRDTLCPNVTRALNATLRGGVAHVVPLPHVVEEAGVPHGCVFLLRSLDRPLDTGEPLDLRYCKGVTLVELSKKMHNGQFLSKDLLRTPEVQRKLQLCEDALREPRGTPPGVFLAGTPALHKLVETCATPNYPDDPIGRVFNPFFFRSWSPHLDEDGFARVFVSDWSTVHENTCVRFGHEKNEDRFYLVVRWDLPPEITDQLLQLVRHNPDDETWKDLADRKEFRRVVEVSVKARENIAERFAKAAGFSLHLSDRKFVHTTSNVLVANARAPVPGTGGEKKAAVAFYSDCAPTHLAMGGVVSLTNDDPRQPVYWWHGASTPEDPGGEPWDMPEAGNAWPTVGADLVWRKTTLNTLASAGYETAFGFAKLLPIGK